MRRDKRIIREIRTVIDNGKNIVIEILRSEGFSPSERQYRDFQAWRIKDEWKRYQEERMTNYVIEQNNLNDIPLVFPNGKKGSEYLHEVTLDMSKYEDVWFEGLDTTGLKENINIEAGVISLSGTPVEAQTYDFKLCAKVKGWEQGDPILERKFNIAFNADPRDLWIPKPVPADLPFQKDDEASDYVLVPEFEGLPQKDIVVASKRGRSHAQEGKPRDDDFRVSFNAQNGWYVIAVADGAGSAKYSREGSRIACETVEQYCKEKLAEQGEAFEDAIKSYDENRTQDNLKPIGIELNNLLYDAAKKAYGAIEKTVKECREPAEIRDFATTMLIAVCRKFSFGWFVATFGVGDGAIAIYDKNAENVKLLNEPDGGEYAGQTRFLTMKSIFSDRSRFRMALVPDFTALMLMTDGISDPFFETDNNLNKKEKWDELWKNLSGEVDFSDDNVEAKNQLLKWLDFWSPGNHDDRTIAILY